VASPSGQNSPELRRDQSSSSSMIANFAEQMSLRTEFKESSDSGNFAVPIIGVGLN